MNINKLVMPFKREIWEYQRSFYGLFLATGTLILVLAIFGLFQISNNTDLNIHIESENMTFSLGDEEFTESTGDIADKVLTEFVGEFLMLFVLLSGFVSVYYLLESLYSDRKDRSVLFWKSLPVSETQNVLTKFAVGLLVIPVIGLVIGLATVILLATIVSIWLPMVSDHGFWDIWLGLQFVPGIWGALKFIVLSSFWLSPIFGWLLLASAFSKRSPLLWAVAPPLLVMLCETLLFGKSHLAAMISAYVNTFDFDIGSSNTESMVASFNDAFRLAPEVLFGVLLSAIFLFATIWLRNNRFEM